MPAILAAALLIWNVAKGAYDSYQNKKANDALVAERKRCINAKIAKLNENPVIQEEVALGEGAKRKPKGRGLYTNRKPKVLGGSVKPKKKKETKSKSLYMNRKSKVLGGSVKKRKGRSFKKKGRSVNEVMKIFSKKKC